MKLNVITVELKDTRLYNHIVLSEALARNQGRTYKGIPYDEHLNVDGVEFTFYLYQGYSTTKIRSILDSLHLNRDVTNHKTYVLQRVNPNEKRPKRSIDSVS